jgi:hypothetical protein
LDPDNNYFSKWTPSVGKSGGILCGIKTDSLDVNAVKPGKYMLQFNLWDKIKNATVVSLLCMGILMKIRKLISSLSYLPFAGGDFNVLRHSGEKNKNFVHSHSIDLFNSVILILGLREIFMNGGQYTWSNKQTSPSLEKLDRVLMSSGWEDMFPLVSVRKLVRYFSDHNALLLDTNIQPPSTSKSREFMSTPEFLSPDALLHHTSQSQEDCFCET